MPASLLDYIKSGDPFKASFDTEDEPDLQYLAQKPGRAAAKLT